MARDEKPARGAGGETARGGTFAAVYAAAARIPRGRVMTYGDIADRVGGGCTGRVVGFAMAAAPEGAGLPCHRVVNRRGDMAPGFCFGGPDRQRRLLKREGGPFLPDGRIDLARARVTDIHYKK